MERVREMSFAESFLHICNPYAGTIKALRPH